MNIYKYLNLSYNFIELHVPKDFRVQKVKDLIPFQGKITYVIINRGH